jgi:ADP-heptose:LPS heptosyltransferase
MSSPFPEMGDLVPGGTTGAGRLPRFAEPRPAMRGRYLIRNPSAVRVIGAMDALLVLWRAGRSSPEAPPQPRRILVADWAHLGNVLLALPALRLLRNSFPDAKIGFLTGSWSRHVIEGTGLYDHLHLVDHFLMSRAQLSRLDKIRRYLEMRRRAVAEMRTIGYEAAIDLSCHFPPVSPLFYSARIPVRAGFTSGGFGPLLTHPVGWVHASRPISDYPRDLLRALWPSLALASEALVPCYPGYPRPGLTAELAGKPYLLLHMGSGAPHKEWPEENWAAVAAALAGQGLHLAFAGSGAREAERIRRVVAGLPGANATFLLDRPWPDYVGTVARAAHVICLDSSSAHIAAAFSVPTTVIYPGLVDPVQWGPCNPNARVLTAPVGCAPCYRNRGCAAMACIRHVTPGQVVDAVRAALPDPGRPGGMPTLS